jgi:hypothetical protein
MFISVCHAILLDAVRATVSIDPCGELCIWDGPSMCTEGSVTDANGGCTNYYETPDGDRCYSITSSEGCSGNTPLTALKAGEIVSGLRDPHLMVDIGFGFPFNIESPRLRNRSRHRANVQHTSTGEPSNIETGYLNEEPHTEVHPLAPLSHMGVYFSTLNDEAGYPVEIPSTCWRRCVEFILKPISSFIELCCPGLSFGQYQLLMGEHAKSLGVAIDIIVTNPDIVFSNGELLRAALNALASYQFVDSDLHWSSWEGPLLMSFVKSQEFRTYTMRREVLKVMLMLLSDLALRSGGDRDERLHASMSEVCDTYKDEIHEMMRKDFETERKPDQVPRNSNQLRFIIEHTPFADFNLACNIFDGYPVLKQIIFAHRFQRELWVDQPRPYSTEFFIKRQSILADSFIKLYTGSSSYMKQGLSITFIGEPGIDGGGLLREWLGEVAKSIFNSSEAFFLPVPADRNTFAVNPEKGLKESAEALDLEYSGIGKIIALSLIYRIPLRVKLASGLWSMILERGLSMNDLEYDDPAMFSSLKKILDTDLDSSDGKQLVFGLTMSLTESIDGYMRTVPLCRNGEDIPVSERNKEAYVRAILSRKYLGSVKVQTHSLVRGFHALIPARMLRALMSPAELNQMLEGEPIVNVEALISKITIGSGYHSKSPQLIWLYEILRDSSVFTQERIRNLLQFVTGDGSVPIGGFTTSAFRVSKDNLVNPDIRLPTSRTCFSRLDLPEYSTKDILKEKLVRAIESKSGFELKL